MTLKFSVVRWSTAARSPLAATRSRALSAALLSSRAAASMSLFHFLYITGHKQVRCVIQNSTEQLRRNQTFSLAILSDQV